MRMSSRAVGGLVFLMLAVMPVVTLYFSLDVIHNPGPHGTGVGVACGAMFLSPLALLHAIWAGRFWDSNNPATTEKQQRIKTLRHRMAGGFLAGAMTGWVFQVVHWITKMPGHVFFAAFLPLICAWIGAILGLLFTQKEEI